jgi:hypothetical protein
MVRRRATFDPLEPTGAPRWYVVRSMHGTLIESQEIPRDSDLKRIFVGAMLEWMDAGRSLGEFSSISATFICNRQADRRMVSIVPTGPHDIPMSGAAHLARCPTWIHPYYWKPASV